jgi:hypothetical protein
LIYYLRFVFVQVPLVLQQHQKPWKLNLCSVAFTVKLFLRLGRIVAGVLAPVGLAAAIVAIVYRELADQLPLFDIEVIVATVAFALRVG